MYHGNHPQKNPRVVSILGTQKKGSTYYFLQFLLAALNKRRGCDIQQFSLPKDGPGFCTGCMNCFEQGMLACPHKEQVQPLWQAMCEADLVILAQPTYVFGAPAQVKAFLDHLGCRWLVHSPEPMMLNKHVLILGQATGAGMRKGAGTVKTSFRFLGAARITTCTFTIQNGTLENISPNKKATIERKLDRLAQRMSLIEQVDRPSVFVRFMFHAMRLGHSAISKNERKQSRPDTYDYLYWKNQGWLDKKWPWLKRADNSSK